MSRPDIGIASTKVGLLADNEYARVTRLLCRKARRRVYANVFIVELVAAEAGANGVLKLLSELRDANARGVDVRLLIGGSKSNTDIQDMTEGSWMHCRRLGIPARLKALESERSDHKKLVVIDDHVLVGSHNWSPGAFGDQIQDSVIVEDERLACFFAHQFAEDWRASEKVGNDVCF